MVPAYLSNRADELSCGLRLEKYSKGQNQSYSFSTCLLVEFVRLLITNVLMTRKAGKAP